MGINTNLIEFKSNNSNFASKISPSSVSKRMSISFFNNVKFSMFKFKVLISNSMFASVITNFYKTDPMSSSSKILSMCSSSFSDEKRLFNE